MNDLNLKSILKSLKLNESTISMILGAIVIVIVGVMIVNLFGRKEEGESIPPVETEEISLPTLYKVQEGEDLWKISEKFYGTGYNWVDIANANNISNPNQIVQGQELSIPDVEPVILAQETKMPEVSPSEITTEDEDKIMEEISLEDEKGEFEITDKPISGASYTVIRGDTLWDISVRAYGDGYRWVDIAEENNLANPDLIHRGNVFVIPR